MVDIKECGEYFFGQNEKEEICCDFCAKRALTAYHHVLANQPWAPTPWAIVTLA